MLFITISFLILLSSQLKSSDKKLTLIHRQEKYKTSLILKNQGDRSLLATKTIINEVKAICHKVFCLSSTKKRNMIRG
jgi:hypothetical protein